MQTFSSVTSSSSSPDPNQSFSDGSSEDECYFALLRKGRSTDADSDFGMHVGMVGDDLSQKVPAPCASTMEDKELHPVEEQGAVLDQIVGKDCCHDAQATPKKNKGKMSSPSASSCDDEKVVKSKMKGHLARFAGFLSKKRK